QGLLQLAITLPVAHEGEKIGRRRRRVGPRATSRIVDALPLAEVGIGDRNLDLAIIPAVADGILFERRRSGPRHHAAYHHTILVPRRSALEQPTVRPAIRSSFGLPVIPTGAAGFVDACLLTKVGIGPRDIELPVGITLAPMIRLIGRVGACGAND